MTYGPDYSCPFVKNWTTKEINKKRLITDKFAKKIHEACDMARRNFDKPQIMAIIDEKYCGILDLAKSIIRLQKSKEEESKEQSSNIESTSISTEDYLKLSFLFDGNS